MLSKFMSDFSQHSKFDHFLLIAVLHFTHNPYPWQNQFYAQSLFLIEFTIFQINKSIYKLIFFNKLRLIFISYNIDLFCDLFLTAFKDLKFSSIDTLLDKRKIKIFKFYLSFEKIR
jgi:hypothetical protein